MSAPERGATLIEMLISLALISILIMAAGPLIIQSARVFATTGRALTDPETTTVSGWFRRDIHNAVSVAAVTGEWSTLGLGLRQQDDEVVVYEAIGDTLIRRRFDLAGELLDRRVLTRGLERWRWRAYRGLIEVEIEFLDHLDPATAASIAEYDRLDDVTRAELRLCLGLRNFEGHSW